MTLEQNTGLYLAAKDVMGVATGGQMRAGFHGDRFEMSVPRSRRPEWNVVGLLGQVPIKTSAVKNPNWRKMYDVTQAAEMWFIKS